MTTTTVAENPALAEWVNELRTTDRPQGKYRLHTIDHERNTTGFCCLGVWCDMLVQKGAPIEVEVMGSATWYDETEDVLPSAAARALGVVNTNPRVEIQNENHDPNDTYQWATETLPDGRIVERTDNPTYFVNTPLSMLNDDAGLTFSQIADLVEYAGLTSEIR